MNRILLAAAALIVVAATLVIALVAIPAPSGTQLAALVCLLLGLVYLFAVVLVSAGTRRGDSTNYLPAILAAALPVVGSLVLLGINAPVIAVIIVEVVAWAIAFAVLLVSIVANRTEARQTEAPSQGFGVTPGKG